MRGKKGCACCEVGGPKRGRSSVVVGEMVGGSGFIEGRLCALMGQNYPSLLIGRLSEVRKAGAALYTTISLSLSFFTVTRNFNIDLLSNVSTTMILRLR